MLKTITWLTETQVAEILSLSVYTLRNNRSKGRGLPYSKIGRTIRYNLAEIQCYMEKNQIQPRA